MQHEILQHIINTEFRSVLLAPACNTHQIFAQDAVGKKRYSFVEHAELFCTLLTKFQNAKACHISLG